MFNHHTLHTFWVSTNSLLWSCPPSKLYIPSHVLFPIHYNVTCFAWMYDTFVKHVWHMSHKTYDTWCDWCPPFSNATPSLTLTPCLPLCTLGQAQPFNIYDSIPLNYQHEQKYDIKGAIPMRWYPFVWATPFSHPKSPTHVIHVNYNQSSIPSM